MERSLKNKILIECAIMVGLATVLSLIKIYEAPLGGSVTLLSMLPIIVISFRRGVSWGLGSAFVYSILQILTGLNTIAYAATTMGIVGTVIFDYILPFTIIGLAGIFYKGGQKGKMLIVSILAGTFFVLVLRYASHVFSGAIIWYELTKEQEWNEYVSTVGRWTYTLVYNIAYMGPEAALTLAASPIIIKLKDILR
ncbi:MAG: hypothetical protein A2Y15_01015 [Clostridiales bacterium GWF2_36_10]|nr:MAG: hypothetical protein A2Y15_01015 [Clostridiales bacterium GWF2_36_10]HAN20560.1 energy-coupled thiamine transporter ThiT [Clostridiales bacterium]